MRLTRYTKRVCLLVAFACLGYVGFLHTREVPYVITSPRRSEQNNAVQSSNATKPVIKSTAASGYATRICSQTERLAHIEKYCRQSYHASMDSLMWPSGRNLVDFRHNLTYCWMSKAGCTSLKAFILEANGMDIKENSTGDSLNAVHYEQIVNQYGIKSMYELNVTQRRLITASFFNVVSIRHPFDRLASYYRDKLVDTDPTSNHPESQAKILRFARPELFNMNRTLNAMVYPQQELGPPRFEEFMLWAYTHRQMDEHWNFITEACHPCAHPWGAILRIETMERDGQTLRERLKMNATGIPVRHSHEGKRDYLEFNRHLAIYENVTSEVIDYWLDFYRTDMEMFGYQWNREKLVATCSIQGSEGRCC